MGKNCLRSIWRKTMVNTATVHVHIKAHLNDFRSLFALDHCYSVFSTFPNLLGQWQIDMKKYLHSSITSVLQGLNKFIKNTIHCEMKSL